MVQCGTEGHLCVKLCEDVKGKISGSWKGMVERTDIFTANMSILCWVTKASTHIGFRGRQVRGRAEAI